MTEKKLEIKVALQIQRPLAEVYEAIVDPAKMSRYFISYGSGRMDENDIISWRFPEFDMEFPVRMGKISKPDYISFYWEVEGNELLVEIILEKRRDGSSLVTVCEKSGINDEAGIKWLKSNTEGWANFLACLKAYTEYGINLRKGAFTYMTEKE